jgi:hypothetical protein
MKEAEAFKRVTPCVLVKGAGRSRESGEDIRATSAGTSTSGFDQVHPSLPNPLTDAPRLLL